jgi:hypothetical protein
MLRAGMDGVGDPSRMSMAQLGVVLRALTIQQKRLDRWLGESG